MTTADRSDQLQTLLRKHRAQRLGNLDRDMPFSWIRCFISIFSYCLLLSDVLRSGLAAKAMDFPKIDPDRIVFFGPYGYPVAHIAHNASVTSTQGIWAYKYDTTSIALRAYAEYFQLEAWPAHLLYRGPESSSAASTIDASTLFRMLDSLVDAMAGTPSLKMSPSTLTLRTRSAWLDRVHDYVLPQFFVQQMTRTNQALYYSDELLDSPGFTFCAQNLVQPYACTDFWTNFARNCINANPLCTGIGHLWDHIRKQRRLVQQKYPSSHVELLVLEGQTDPSKVAISFQGRKFFDVVVITRIRDCLTEESPGSSLPANCSTVMVDDFRYEGVALTTTVTSLYVIVASLRCVGQMYAWIRLTMLYLGCFYARSAEVQYADAALSTRLLVALRTMFIVPSQVVIYGSIFPIACYVTAHIVDSATVYEIVSQSFTTSLGVFKLNFCDFLSISAVSMRSVWVLASLLHAIIFLRTRQNWSPADGIPAIPEFSVSFISCLTVMAQFRSLSFRDTRVEFIANVVPSHNIVAIQAAAFDNSRSFWGVLFFGNTLDVQALIGSAMAMNPLVLVLWCVLKLLAKLRVIGRADVSFAPRTKVSYAAGTLWPVNCLVVSWNGLNRQALLKHKPKPLGTNSAKPVEELGANLPVPTSPGAFESVAVKSRCSTEHFNGAPRLWKEEHQDLRVLVHREAGAVAAGDRKLVARCPDPVEQVRAASGSEHGRAALAGSSSLRMSDDGKYDTISRKVEVAFSAAKLKLLASISACRSIHPHVVQRRRTRIQAAVPSTTVQGDEIQLTLGSARPSADENTTGGVYRLLAFAAIDAQSPYTTVGTVYQID